MDKKVGTTRKYLKRYLFLNVGHGVSEAIGVLKHGFRNHILCNQVTLSKNIWVKTNNGLYDSEKGEEKSL